jgi:hypothetical protein
MTREEQRRLLLLNTVWQELAAIKNRGAAQHLLPLLMGHEGVSLPAAGSGATEQEAALADSTELLLLVKKWTEFLARYKVPVPHCLERKICRFFRNGLMDHRIDTVHYIMAEQMYHNFEGGGRGVCGNYRIIGFDSSYLVTV